MPCVQPSFGKLEFKIPDFTPEQFLGTSAIIRKVICIGEVLPKFSNKSVPYLRAMCLPKFQTILIQNGRLNSIFVFSNWNIFFIFFVFKSNVPGRCCPNFPCCPNLFLISVPCLQSSFWTFKFFKWPDYRHFCWLSNCKVVNILTVAKQ